MKIKTQTIKAVILTTGTETTAERYERQRLNNREINLPVATTTAIKIILTETATESPAIITEDLVIETAILMSSAAVDRTAITEAAAMITTIAAK